MLLKLSHIAESFYLKSLPILTREAEAVVAARQGRDQGKLKPPGIPFICNKTSEKTNNKTETLWHHNKTETMEKINNKTETQWDPFICNQTIILKNGKDKQ